MSTPDTTTDTAQVDAELLADCIAELSGAAKRRILAKRQQRVDGMRSSEAPGHVFWYPIHVAARDRAAAALGLSR